MEATTEAYDRRALIKQLQFAFIVDEVGVHMSEVICGIGMFLNGLLCYLILTKTPVHMRAYAVLLFNFAFFDFFTCLASLFACQKPYFTGVSLVYIFLGPCKYVAPWLCYFCHCVVCHAMAHSQNILLISFIYRYWILVDIQPRIGQMIGLSVAFYSVSLTFFVFYYLDIGDSSELMRILTTFHPQNHYDDETIWGKITVSGNTSIFRIASLAAIVYMTLPCVPIYALILTYRKKTLKILASSALNMSETTRKGHAKLIKALTIQAAIPLFWLVASGIFTMSEFGIVSGPIPEVITFRLMECIPMTSPMVALIFISPYRIGLLKMIAKTGLIKYGDGNKVGNVGGESKSNAKPSAVDTAADLA
ncbi:unnamed protein product [Caenorhabditis bovis]|uniref:G-protein coupled receptors family 1 profile domain-containing protein n=1 Tax=Caenorhabditis bovis TaxID=2654633 RepID=A0A8S1F3T7_9PELO|nr:unnamed protein product [Caenorhabditis bovis]